MFGAIGTPEELNGLPMYIRMLLTWPRGLPQQSASVTQIPGYA